MPALTAITASAASYAVRSTQDGSRYPPPSCSAFHGLRGSSEWAVTTCGTPCSTFARCPAMLAYQVWEWARSTPPSAATIDRSTPSVCSAGFASASDSGGWCAYVSGAFGRGSPKQCTSTSTSSRSAGGGYGGGPPAPP